jgi:hypothetical protein
MKKRGESKSHKRLFARNQQVKVVGIVENVKFESSIQELHQSQQANEI